MTLMAEQGGYRRPENPAPVSGPGALSQRTDGGQPARYMSGGQYGEGQELMELQTSAPMSKGPKVPAPRPSAGSRRPSGGGGELTSLFAPTERPMEPLTAGAPFGPGPNSSGAPPPDAAFNKTIQQYLPALEAATRWPDAPETFKSLVRYLQGVR